MDLIFNIISFVPGCLILIKCQNILTKLRIYGKAQVALYALLSTVSVHVFARYFDVGFMLLGDSPVTNPSVAEYATKMSAITIFFFFIIIYLIELLYNSAMNSLNREQDDESNPK